MIEHSPCGKPCDGCEHQEDCPVTQEAWDKFLSGMSDFKMKSTDALNYINYDANINRRVDITPLERVDDEDGYLTTEQEKAVQEGRRRVGNRDPLEALVDGEEWFWNFAIPREDLKHLFEEAIGIVLTPIMQERLILWYKHGKSYVEIAEIEGVKESAVRKSIKRALELIGRYIEAILEGRNEA